VSPELKSSSSEYSLWSLLICDRDRTPNQPQIPIRLVRLIPDHFVIDIPKDCLLDSPSPDLVGFFLRFQNPQR